VAIAKLTSALKLGLMNGTIDLQTDLFKLQLMGKDITESGTTISFPYTTYSEIPPESKVGDARSLVKSDSGATGNSWNIEGDGSSIVYAKTLTGGVANSPFDFTGVSDILSTGFIVYHSVSGKIILVASFGSTKAVGVITFTNNRVFGLQ